MRKFKRINRVLSRQLLEIFPSINQLYAKAETKGYKLLSISVFNHWLSQEEAIEEIDLISADKIERNDRKLHDFCTALAVENKCYLIKRLGRRKNDITFREFSSEISRKECLGLMPYNYGSKGRFVLAFPEMEIIYFEDWDFTHHIYYKDSEKLSQFRTLVEKYEVYILEKL